MNLKKTNYMQFYLEILNIYYKKFPEVLELAAKAGIMDQFLFTNGTLLNRKNSEIILNSS